MKLIIGLGNPGKKYEETRHNIGWQALDELARRHDAAAFHDQSAFKSSTTEIKADGQKLLLAKPLTFMNESGEAVRLLQQFYKIPLEDMLIVQDEMDFAPGIFAFLAKGGPAGHNGIISIQEKLGSDAIARLRLGIGRPTPPMTKEAYVLGRPVDNEEAIFQKMRERSEKAIFDWATLGLDKAMNTWNGVKSDSLLSLEST